MERRKRIYGLIGYPVRHSLSPIMHNAAFQYLKERKEIDYDAEYRLFEVKPQELDDFLNNLEKNNIYGLNVTIPHKVPLLVENKNGRTDPSCVLAGAINTVKRDGDELYYYNTDIRGFIDSLREDLKFDARDKNVFVFGCGGAGRAVVAGLNTQGLGIKKIYMYDINKEALESTKKHFDRLANNDLLKIQLDYILDYKQVENKIKDVRLLVNASPVGMKEGDGSIVNKNLLHNGLYVYDLVYNRETQLIKDAKACKLNYINGLKMLWRQGMLSFEIWVNDKESPKKKAPQEVMWKALCSQISLQ